MRNMDEKASRRDAVLAYDGTPTGVLTAAAVALEDDLWPELSKRGRSLQLALWAQSGEILSDTGAARRIWRLVDRRLQRRALRDLRHALHGDTDDEATDVCRSLVDAAAGAVPTWGPHAAPWIANCFRTARRVRTELHRYKGLIRFRRLLDGVYYGPFRPRHNIVFSLAPHFQRRLPDQRWVLHDVTRDTAVLWDGSELWPVDVEHALSKAMETRGRLRRDWLHEDEAAIQESWQAFFRHIAIPERRNHVLQQALVPRHYRLFLTESMT